MLELAIDRRASSSIGLPWARKITASSNAHMTLGQVRRGHDSGHRVAAGAVGDQHSQGIAAIHMNVGYQSGPAPATLGIPVCAVSPPSTTMIAPLIYEASSDARNSTTLAISLGSP
jgi:hypothetical protein